MHSEVTPNQPMDSQPSPKKLHLKNQTPKGEWDKFLGEKLTEASYDELIDTIATCTRLKESSF